jgi:hypothetical protein
MKLGRDPDPEPMRVHSIVKGFEAIVPRRTPSEVV